MTSKDLLLSVPGSSDGQIVEGRTRFMNLILLLEKEAEELDVDYQFEPHKIFQRWKVTRFSRIVSFLGFSDLSIYYDDSSLDY